MDYSLLVVLAVIGVILILAGIARMRSKSKHQRDEIDHSVLFDAKHHANDLADDEFEIRRIHRIEAAGTDPALRAEREEVAVTQSSENISADSDEIRIKVDTSDRPHSSHDERPIARDRARSILSKLRLDAKDEEEQTSAEPAIKQYRDSAPDKVVVLNIMAANGEGFAGPVLVDAIESMGMIYGEMEIFHLYSDNAPLFSLVNMVKPGTFDMPTIDTFTTPGVSLFIQLPNKQGNGLEAFDTMLDVAQRLTAALGGTLCDERRSVLTHSAIDYTRQQLAEYDCKWLAPA